MNFRLNAKEFQLIDVANSSSLERSNYNPQRPTKIFAHGWNGLPDKGYIIRDGIHYPPDTKKLIKIKKLINLKLKKNLIKRNLKNWIKKKIN